jgi:hypothetical protein
MNFLRVSIVKIIRLIAYRNKLCIVEHVQAARRSACKMKGSTEMESSIAPADVVNAVLLAVMPPASDEGSFGRRKPVFNTALASLSSGMACSQSRTPTCFRNRRAL